MWSLTGNKRKPKAFFPDIRFVVDVNGTEAANHRREQRPDPKGPGLEAIHCVVKNESGEKGRTDVSFALS